MIVEIGAKNVPRAYVEGLWKLKIMGVRQASRNGDVLSIPDPVVLTIDHPIERVLLDAKRDANPFFHVMEFCWMMAGSNDAKWISQFNKRMMEYADAGILRGAYGHRWQYCDQIRSTINLLRKEPGTRQAVLSMWNPLFDGSDAKSSDRPCNTHIYFRVSPTGMLDMMVCNRSNDFIWGMLGANAVHMTLLHELIAHATGIPIGKYRVVTNNLHVYVNIWNKEMTPPDIDDPYPCNILPLLQNGESYEDLMADCTDLLELLKVNPRTVWMEQVALPMYDAYLDKSNRMDHMIRIKAEDWRTAAMEWNDRREQKRLATEARLG